MPKYIKNKQSLYLLGCRHFGNIVYYHFFCIAIWMAAFFRSGSPVSTRTILSATKLLTILPVLVGN